MQRRYSRIIACQSGPSFRHCAAVPILFDFRHRCCSKWHGMFNDQRRAKGLKDCSNSACCLIVGTRRRDQSCHRADWRQKNPRMNDRGECCLSVRSGKHQLRNAGNADGPVTFRQGDRSRHSAKSRRLAKRNAEPCTVNANKNSAAPIQVTTLWAEFGPFILLPFVLGVFLLRKGMRE